MLLTIYFDLEWSLFFINIIDLFYSWIKIKIYSIDIITSFALTNKGSLVKKV